MKRYLLAIILLGLHFVLHAQDGYWEEAKGPYGGRTTIFPTHTNKVYAFIFTHYNELTYRSVDFGKNWEILPVSEADSTGIGERLRIGISGNFYKIVSYDTGSDVVRKLFISLDEGSTWSLQNSDLLISELKEVDSGHLIGAEEISGKVFQSFDMGASWQEANLLSAYSTNEVFTAKTTPDGKLLLTNSFKKFAYSSNGGVSWIEGQIPSSPKGFLSNAGTLFGVFGSSTIYRSTDIGVTWDTTVFNLAQNEKLVTIMNLNNGKLLLSSTFNLFTSSDEGETWSVLPQSPEQAQGLLLNYPLPNGDILARRKDALFRSSDDGNTWSFSTFGIRQAAAIQLAFIGDSTQLVVAEAGLWKTKNGGESWDRIMPETSSTFLSQDHPLAVLNSDTFAVAIGLNLWITKNGGQSFSEDTLVGQLSRRNVFAGAGMHLFCTGLNGILRSNGVDGIWSTIIPNEALYTLEEHPSGDLYALTESLDNSLQKRTFWRSQDAGVTWEEITTLALAFDLNKRWALEIAYDGNIYIQGFYKNTVKMAISTDGAVTWDYKTIRDIYPGRLLFAVNNIGRIFTQSIFSQVKIFTSADSGESWYSLPSYNIDQNYLNGMEFGPSGQLYVLPGSGTMYRTITSTEQGAYIRGQVSRDADVDCSTYDPQEPLKNWAIELEGKNTFYNTTNENGRYTFFVDTGQYTIKAVIPQNFWWALCDTIQEIDATDLLSSDTVNFAALPLAYCPLISVNVATPQLRRCFDNSVYVEYCNQGTETADSAWVDVTLDPFLTLVSTAQPHEVQASGAIRFFFGDVPSGDCGQFQLTVYVNCDSTVLGQTHCITAHGFPDTLCTELPAWSGANIRASATCQDSLLQFKLENDGSAPSQTLDYIIIEDDVVLFSGQKNYTTGESITMEYPANGKTWRIESEQEPGHPFSFLVLAFAEGCGGFESLGYINQFPVNGSSPSWHRMCVENIGSYDPNDKQGFPIGTGSEHNIRPGQTIDYLVRFQNTGTDTAFTVVIKDTLSAFLDPLSIRPGASSHAYTWSLSGQGVINFTFNNIMLPDSNVNEPASNGFVQFSITPYLDVPLGSVIENDAAIYFDFNEPIITNTTWHTIQKSPLTSALWSEPQKTAPSLLVWPNPFNERINVRLNQKSSGTLLLKIYDSRGTLVAQKTTNGPEIELNARQLPAGLYWAEVRDAQGRLVGNGKLVKE